VPSINTVPRKMPWLSLPTRSAADPKKRTSPSASSDAAVNTNAPEGSAVSDRRLEPVRASTVAAPLNRSSAVTVTVASSPGRNRSRDTVADNDGAVTSLSSRS
jgi:hypothetical protein